MVGGTALFYPMFCTFFAKVKCAKARALFAENKVRFARAEQLCRKLTLAFSSIRLFSVLSVAKRHILQQKCLKGTGDAYIAVWTPHRAASVTCPRCNCKVLHGR